MFYGIDLGTTKSAIGFWQDGKPCIIPDKFGSLSIPSLVLVTPEKEIFAGVQAKKHSDRYSSKHITISSVKRLNGRQGQTGWGWWKTYPQEIAAFILSELKYQAEQYTGEKVTDAVIAIPSHFDENQRRATKEAAWIAGINVLRLLNEATAAVLSYGMHIREEEKILVFDMGGGTLDISIAEIGERVYEIKCIEGDSKLGGDDFDQIIVDYILDSIYKKHGIHVELDTVQEMILKEIAETAKIELSSKLSTHIHIPGFFNIENNYHDLDLSIDRKMFEELSKNLFDRAINLFKVAINSAGLSLADLNKILLLGGCCRIPYLKELLENEFKISPVTAINKFSWVKGLWSKSREKKPVLCKGVDIETCVAQGAIIQAAIFEEKIKDVLLLDVIGSSYGIGLENNIFSKLIEKNTTVPVKRSQVFTTTEDNQTTVQIRLYQGENPIASDNDFLGTIELKGIPLAKKGVPKIEVTFEVDPNMIVHVSAKDVASGKTETIRVQSPYSLNDSQIRLMNRKLSVWQVERELFDNKEST